MISDFSELFRVLLGTLSVFAVLVLLFRKHILHLFDPLFYYLITQAFSIQLAFMIITNISLLITFLISQTLFLLGFFVTVGPALTKHEKQKGFFFRPVKTGDISVLKWYAIFGTIILIVGNLILIKEKGITLFSSDPSVAKVDNFTEGTGLGIVRRLNSGLLYLVALIVVYLYIYKKQLRYGLLIFLLIIFAAFTGSKSALIFFIFLSAFFFCFKDLNKDAIVTTLKKGSYFILILSFFLICIIILGSGEDSVNKILLALATRFLFYGDAIIYYFRPDSMQHFAKNNVFDFLYDEFNSVLGFLRLVPYEQPLNFRLINYFYNIPKNETFGPNIPYYIKGNIYFGLSGGFIYSFIIGCSVGFVRKFFYKIVRNNSSSIISSILVIYLNIIIYSLPQDSVLFITKIFDIFFLSIPLIIAVIIIHLPKPKFKLNNRIKTAS